MKREIEHIHELLSFLESDMWYSIHNEFKSEDDMIKYLNDHFNICLKQIEEDERIQKLFSDEERWDRIVQLLQTHAARCEEKDCELCNDLIKLTRKKPHEKD